MTNRRLNFLLSGLVVTATVSVGAQSSAPPTRSLTNDELRARIKTLEEENAGLKRDYELLLSTCQSQAAADPVPTPATPSSTERAAAALADVRLAEANRIALQREQQRLEDDLWRVVSVDYAITESNKVFLRFGWKLTISNGLDRTQAFDVTVQFLDKAGFVVDTDREYNHTIAAFDQQTLTGSHLISLPGALNVASVRATATRRR